MIYSLILLNKPAINSDKNEKMGRIKGYVFDPDKKSVIALLLAPVTEKASLDIIPFSAIKSIYDNAVITEGLPNPIQITDTPDILNIFLKDIAVIGAQVLTDEGMLAGTVRDFAFSEKNGQIAQISINPEKSGASRIDAKHIIKITQQRIMVSAQAMKEEPPAPPQRVVPKAQAIEALAETVETSAPLVEEDKLETAATPEVSAPIETINQFVPESQGSTESSSAKSETTSSDIKSILQESFIELTRILVGRLNSIDPANYITQLKNELIETIKSDSASSVETEEGQVAASELIIEEKIKKSLSAPLNELKEEISNLRETLSSIITESLNKPQKVEVQPADLSPIQNDLSKIENTIVDKIASLNDLVSGIRIPALDPINDTLNSLSGIIEKIDAKSPAKDDLHKQISEHGVRLEERSDAFHKTYMLELGQQFDGIRKVISERNSELNEKTDVIKNTLANEAERISSNVRDIVSGISLPESDLNLNSVESSFSKLLNNFKEQFAAALSNEIVSKSDERSSESERRLIDSINNIVEPLKRDIFLPDQIESSVAEKFNSMNDKFKESFNYLLDEIRNSQPATDVSEKINSLSARFDEINEALSDIVESSFSRFAGENEGKASEIRSVIDSLHGKIDSFKEEFKATVADRSVGDKDELLNKIENLFPHFDEFHKRIERVQNTLIDTIDSKMAERADLSNRSAENLQELIRKLENRIVELREIQKSAEGELDHIRRTILDEIKAFSSSVMKPEDMMIVREWIQEVIPELKETADTKTSEVVSEAIKDFKAASQQTRDELESFMSSIGLARDDMRRILGEFSSDIREHLLAGIEAGREGFAEVKDLDELREKVESKIGDLVDDFAERVETRLDQRDRYYEEGVKAVLSNIEKLINRNSRFDFENVFSGGGLISSLFGGRTSADQPMKLTSRTSQQQRQSAKPMDSPDQQDPQIRRFAYLIGKQVHKDVSDADGNILARAGDTVNEHLIRLARDRQRTLELIRAVDFKD